MSGSIERGLHGLLELQAEVEVSVLSAETVQFHLTQSESDLLFNAELISLSFFLGEEGGQ